MRCPPSATEQRNRLVVLVAGDLTQILDLAGPAEVFSRAARIGAVERPDLSLAYRVKVVSITGDALLSTTAGVSIQPHCIYSELRERADTVLVVGGANMEDLAFDEKFLRWLRRQATQTRRVGAVCTGAFALAAAGLLNGKRATTHWDWAKRLAELFPNVRVDSDPIYTCDSGVYTSAGVTAGMDLSLALVEEDFGSDLALRIARELVLYLRRPGSQSQFSAPLAGQLSERRPIRELQLWLPSHLRGKLTVDRLAHQAGMSVRNFSRVFLRDVGMSPGEYVDRLRVEVACLRLSQSSHGLSRIATDCGYQSREVLRRSMIRIMNVTPKTFRAAFGSRG